MASKYNAKKVPRKLKKGVHTFASIKESQRYDELMLLLRAGKIRKLKIQPQFTLQESYVTEEGERVRAIRYTADFSYEEKMKVDSFGVDFWAKVVEDCKVKPTKTEAYQIRKRLLVERFGVSVRET